MEDIGGWPAPLSFNVSGDTVNRLAKAATVAVGGLLLSMTLVSPVRAEGNWSSSVSNALTGFQSRDWTDNNSDSASTRTVWSGCSVVTGTYQNTTLDLARNRTWPLPDATYGERTTSCGTFNWGRMTDVGSYHWTIKKINGSTSGWRVNVNSLTTYY
jgi:hypothetical protein